MHRPRSTQFPKRLTNCCRLEVGLPECPTEKKDERDEFAAGPPALSSPCTRRLPQNRGACRVRHWGSLQRQTPSWREADSNPRSPIRPRWLSPRCEGSVPPWTRSRRTPHGPWRSHHRPRCRTVSPTTIGLEPSESGQRADPLQAWWNARVRTSMLSRVSISGEAVGSSKAECAVKRAVPSSTES